jgi:hypothetical protein
LLKRPRDIPAGLIAIILVLIFSLAWPALSMSGDLLPIIVDFNGGAGRNGLPTPWLLRVTDGEAHVRVFHENSGNILCLRCENSSFSVERDVSVSPEEYPYATWEWKATRLPLSGDVRKKTRNDQGLQILFAFENRKIISYVWDSNAPEGTVTDESIGWPLNISIKVVVVNSGTAATDEWVSNTRNICSDYRRLFNEKPPRISGLRIQANTQYTRDSSEGMIRNITFTGKDTVVSKKKSQVILAHSVPSDSKKRDRGE